jgi:hypothetical protein
VTRGLCVHCARAARCPLNSVIERVSEIRWTLPLLPATGANRCLMQPLSLFWNTARACQQRRQPWGEGVEALQHHAEAALSSCIHMSSPNLLDDLVQTLAPDTRHP